ncbi:MAG TPA: hypothetical protein VM580_12560 [Labilithrix sp.]|jgi:hypothetical protein|nr:hypothetical protein [Labilithrix sp.]
MRQFLIGAICLGLLLSVRDASADIQACLRASEKGQRARATGKLREAREQFVICGAESCPALVRHDCAQWTSEIVQVIPTVVFGAKDKNGRDLFDVTVSVDGEVLVKKLDGKTVMVDPGKHTFLFEAPGMPPVTSTALIKEGDRTRAFNIAFDGGPDLPPSNSKTPTKPRGNDKPARGHTPYPWILVGVGGAGLATGLALVFTAPDRPSNCDPKTETCVRLPGQSDADFTRDKQTAGTADSQPLLGYAVIGAGAALVAGGLVWHFLEPTGRASRSSSGLRLTPWTTGKSTGVTLGGNF